MKHIVQPRAHSATRVFLALLTAIVLIACGKKAPEVPAVAGDSGGKSSVAAEVRRNPCSLLEPRDVESALGGSLVGPPYRFNKGNAGWGPAADGDVCRYEGANYHFIQVEVEWEGGAQVMKMYGTVQNLANQRKKGVLKLIDGSELAGEWDEATVLNCCGFIAMRGDQLVTVDIAGSNATLEQAAGIADAALKRIDKPLSVDVAAGVAAAIARDAMRPKKRDTCSLVSRAAAEAAIEAPLAKDPVAEGDTCTYTYTGKLPWTIVLTTRWRDSYPEFRQHAALEANVGKAFSLGGDGGQDKKELAAPDAALAGPWEAAHMGMFEFSAVKKDVLIKADATGARKREHARNLVAAAMSNL
jgi:hypothetical protein